jgi:hypothetical protein
LFRVLGVRKSNFAFRLNRLPKVLSDPLEGIMKLWLELYRCICFLRPACSRAATFAWMMLALVAMCARPDLAGVTSFVRAGWLKECCYFALLHLFHSSAVKLDRLTALWSRLVLLLFTPLAVDGYRICIGDGIKIPKEGKKMPAVKCLHNESENNSKGEYIFVRTPLPFTQHPSPNVAVQSSTARRSS